MRNWEVIPATRKYPPDEHELHEEERYRNDVEGVHEKMRPTVHSNTIRHSRVEDLRRMSRDNYLSKIFPGFEQANHILEAPDQYSSEMVKWAKRVVDKGYQKYGQDVCLEVVEGCLGLEESLIMTLATPEYRTDIKEAAKIHRRRKK